MENSAGNPQKKGGYTDEVTLKDVIVTGHRFVRESLRKWWIYLLFFLIVGAVKAYQYFNADVEYKATVTFMRDEDESGGSSVSSILGQFGFGRRASFNMDRVVELAKSRTIIHSAIFDRATIDGRSDFIANHVIDEYALTERWAEKDPRLEGFRFERDNIDEFDDLELSALRRIYRFVVGGEDRPGLLSLSYSESSSILSFNAITTDQRLSIVLVNHVFDNLAEYYVDNAVKKQKATYEIVKQKADSIGALLTAAELEYARVKDANQNLWSEVSRVRQQQLYRDIHKLNAIHVEALKNVEVADFALRNATPVIKELDRPLPPLEPIQPSIVKAGAITVLLALLLGATWILGGWLLQNVRSTLKEE